RVSFDRVSFFSAFMGPPSWEWSSDSRSFGEDINRPHRYLRPSDSARLGPVHVRLAPRATSPSFGRELSQPGGDRHPQDRDAAGRRPCTPNEGSRFSVGLTTSIKGVTTVPCRLAPSMTDPPTFRGDTLTALTRCQGAVCDAISAGRRPRRTSGGWRARSTPRACAAPGWRG